MRINIAGVEIDTARPRQAFEDCKISMRASMLETFRRTKGQGTGTPTTHKYAARHANNQMLVNNIYQFMFGTIYRAVHGIFKLAGRVNDWELQDDLDDYLIACNDQNKYGLKIYRGKLASRGHRIYLKGVPWRCGYASPPRNHTNPSNYKRFSLGVDKYAYLRFDNTVEFPYVDMQFYCMERKRVITYRAQKHIWNRTAKQLSDYTDKAIFPGLR